MNHGKIYWAVSDSVTAVRRSLRHIFRNVDSLITGIMLPVIILLLFVVIFGGAIDTGTEYVNYIVPGVILTCVAYGSSSTAMIISRDMVEGLFNRFRTMPMLRSSMLVGHVIGSLARNAISTILVFVVAIAIGFRPNADALDWLMVAGLLTLIVLVFSWISIIFGLVAKSIDAAAVFPFTVMFLPYLSSAFVPTNTLPTWIHGFAQHQPLTPIIDTIRGLLIGTPIGNSGWIALVWTVSLLVIAHTTAVILFRIKASR